MAEKKKKPAPKVQNYRNTGNRNVFTEFGRCPPNGVVMLTPSQAKQYDTLEAVK